MVIKDILSPEECKATIDEMWDYIKQKGYLNSEDFASEKEKETFQERNKGVDRNKPWT